MLTRDFHIRGAELKNLFLAQLPQRQKPCGDCHLLVWRDGERTFGGILGAFWVSGAQQIFGKIRPGLRVFWRKLGGLLVFADGFVELTQAGVDDAQHIQRKDRMRHQTSGAFEF